MERQPGRSDPGSVPSLPTAAGDAPRWNSSARGTPAPWPVSCREMGYSLLSARLQRGHFSSGERLPCLPPSPGRNGFITRCLAGWAVSTQIPGFAICAAPGLWEGAGLTLPFHLTQPSHSRDYPALSKGKLRSRRPPILRLRWAWQPAFHCRSHYQLPHNEPAQLRTWSSRRSWGAAGSGRGQGEAGQSGQGRETTHADEGELILFSTCILSMSVCGGEGQGGAPHCRQAEADKKVIHVWLTELRRYHNLLLVWLQMLLGIQIKGPSPSPTWKTSSLLCPSLGVQLPCPASPSFPSGGSGEMRGSSHISGIKISIYTEIWALEVWLPLCSKSYSRNG